MSTVSPVSVINKTIEEDRWDVPEVPMAEDTGSVVKFGKNTGYPKYRWQSNFSRFIFSRKI